MVPWTNRDGKAKYLRKAILWTNFFARLNSKYHRFRPEPSAASTKSQLSAMDASGVFTKTTRILFHQIPIVKLYLNRRHTLEGVHDLNAVQLFGVVPQQRQSQLFPHPLDCGAVTASTGASMKKTARVNNRRTAHSNSNPSVWSMALFRTHFLATNTMSSPDSSVSFRGFLGNALSSISKWCSSKNA